MIHAEQNCQSLPVFYHPKPFANIEFYGKTVMKAAINTGLLTFH